MPNNNDPFKSVPKDLWPVRSDLWAEHFIPAQEKALNHIQQLSEQNLFDEKTVLNHRQLVNWVGGKAFSAFEFSSSKFWSENDMINQSVEWNLALWQFVHTFPLGFLIATHSLKKEPYRSWNPAAEPINSFSKRGNVIITTSNRHLCGGMISLGLFHQLYVDDGLDPAIYKAILDAFSPHSNIENPISSSFRRAIRGSLFANPYPIPYFWEQAVSYIFERSHAEVDQYRNELRFGASVNPDDVLNALNATSNVKAELTVVESSGTLDEDAPTNNSEQLEATEILTAFFSEIRNQYATHKNPINTKGAMFHMVGNRWFSVHPIVINIAVKALNSHDETENLVSFETLMEGLDSLGFKEAKGVFTQNGESRGNVTLLYWPNEFIQQILPEDTKYTANKSLKIA